jgi:heat shock protein HslJ
VVTQTGELDGGGGRRTVMRLLVVLAAAAIFGACGESEPTADTPATTMTPAPPRLDGKTFVSTEVAGRQLVAGSEIRLSFDGDNLGVSGGCNQLGGTWSIDGDVLVVPPNMIMTEMACDPPELMEQDSWLASFLSAHPTLALDRDTLTLSEGDVTITLLDREVAEPDRPLGGTPWAVESLVSADAVSSLPAGARVPTLQFDAGRVLVDAGCNTGSGDYEATGRDITFGPIAVTRIACDEASMEVEAHVLRVLDGTATYAIEADVLTLTNGDTGLVLRVAG